MSLSSLKRNDWWALARYVGITWIGAGLSALLSSDFSLEGLNAPPLAPPSWLFFPVWAVLYTAMGVAAFLVWYSRDVDRSRALTLYWVQLVVNLLWPIAFFRLEWRWFAFIWILALILLVILTIRTFWPISEAAGWLLVPYLLWLLFAAYLNGGYALLN